MIYQTIRKIAKEKQVPIRKIETDLGFANGTIRKWGDDAPIQKLNRVAGYLEVPIAQLIYGQTSKES